MQQIPCPQCKTPNLSDARFCQRCGYQVAARAADPLVGQQIGNHRILQRIGSGGMGVVYLAEHTNLGKKYAIKFLHPQYAADEEVVERFRREAQVISTLEHENIIRETDFGWLPGFGFYLVMEYLEGRTLKSIIRDEGALSLPRLLGVFQQLCDALDEAHEKGIVHRDLKPENLFITKRRGREILKILDFGIARIVYGKGVSEFTVDGEVYGSPTYMSPEQAKGEINKIDHRSDLYSVGVILFESLTGRAPYRGASPAEVMLAHLNQAPPRVTDLRPDISDNLSIDAVIKKALAKNKEDRFSSALEFYEALLQAFPLVLPANSPRLTSSWPQATGDFTPPEGESPFSPMSLAFSPSVPQSPSQTPSPQPGLPSPLSTEATPTPGLASPRIEAGTPRRSSPLPPSASSVMPESPSQELSAIRLSSPATPPLQPSPLAKSDAPSLPFPGLSIAPSTQGQPQQAQAQAQGRSEVTSFPQRAPLPSQPETTGFRQASPLFPPLPPLGGPEITGFRQKPPAVPMLPPTGLDSTVHRQKPPQFHAEIAYPPASPVGLPSEITPGRSLPSARTADAITPTPSAGSSPRLLAHPMPPLPSSSSGMHLAVQPASTPPAMNPASGGPPVSSAQPPHPRPPEAWLESDYDVSEPTRAVELSLLRGMRPKLPEAFGPPEQLATSIDLAFSPASLHTPPSAASSTLPSGPNPRPPIPPPSFPPPSPFYQQPSLSLPGSLPASPNDPHATPEDTLSSVVSKPTAWKDLRVLGILIGLVGGILILLAVWFLISNGEGEAPDDAGIPKPPSFEPARSAPPPTRPPSPSIRSASSSVGVAFQSNPKGASVYVDAEAKPRCATPCSLYLEVGKPRSFLLRLDGYGLQRIRWDGKDSQSWRIPLVKDP